MKKSLVTLAVMAALAGSAFAQNVQVYGTVDAGIQNVDNAKSTLTVGSGLQSQSIIGFKGTEDLQNGLKAEFVLEQGFNSDTGTTSAANTAFSRQSYVGVGSSSVGTVRLGRQETSVYGVVASVDPMSGGLAGNTLNVVASGAVAQFNNNAITYIAPKIGGFSSQFQYGLGETAGSNIDNSNYSLSGVYGYGPLVVSGAYGESKTNGVGVDKVKTGLVVGGTYDLEVVKGHGLYAESKTTDNVAATTGEVRSYMLGVSKEIGAHKVLASWTHNEVKDMANTNTEQYGLGYTYTLSKRTNVYASYANVKNDSNVALAGASVNGGSVDTYNVGLKHAF
jgi:predicted porin